MANEVSQPEFFAAMRVGCYCRMQAWGIANK